MSLRRRLTLFTALAVALAVAVASVVIYVLVDHRLVAQIDDTLRDRGGAATISIGGRQLQAGGGAAGIATPGPPPGVIPPGISTNGGRLPGAPGVAGGAGGGTTSVEVPPPPNDDFRPRAQLIDGNGVVQRPPAGGAGSGEGDDSIPVTATAKEVAAGNHGEFFSDVEASDGTKLRVLTTPVGEGTALQVARPLTEVDDTLGDLTLILFLVSAGGVALAAGLGLFVSRTALAPAAAVSNAAREVAETKDLTRRIDVRGTDELGTLAASFNEMLAALETSVGAQRRLVADASHELRTPLATLRTNIDTLQRRRDLDPDERDRILTDLDAEMEELGALVGDVVELAREPNEGALVRQDVELAELAAGAVDRARRRARGLTFEEDLDPVVVRGDPARLDRAISNLLDNAIKWSPDGGKVEVTLKGGNLAVRDHGRGFGEHDVDRAFERFYRADDARGMPGSGLGLSIVERIVDEHGGTVQATNAPGGGARVEISLPIANGGTNGDLTNS